MAQPGVLDLSGGGGPVIRVDSEIELRPLAEADVTQRYVDRINDPSISQYLISAMNGPQTIGDVRAMVLSNWQAPDAVLFGIFSSGMHCGNIRLHDITRERAFLGVAVFETHVKGKGIGTRAIAGLARFAVTELGIGEIVAGIDEKNIRSQRAFLKAGFGKTSRSPDGKGSLWKYSQNIS
jgi:RimJ/RimL family protein N-acetyltransferase